MFHVEEFLQHLLVCKVQMREVSYIMQYMIATRPCSNVLAVQGGPKVDGPTAFPSCQAQTWSILK